MQKQLMILEVSQKQAYIFKSKKLKENIANSDIIVEVTGDEYFSKCIKKSGLNYDKTKNMVYSGGGHTILEFDSYDNAVEFSSIVTQNIMTDFPDMEVFVKIVEYNESLKPSENIDNLIKSLELKKSKRKNSFKQKTFGIEKININKENKNIEVKKETKYGNDKYSMVYELDKLGGSKEKSNFISVVHIDGNAMGARVKNLHKENIGGVNDSWDSFKNISKEFSESIDSDFKTAFEETVDEVILNIENGNLGNLNLKDGDLPIRKIITAGDDICFVTDGRIGIECAAMYIRNLSRKINKVDKKNYAACAGVAIVHTKYPFHKAYEISEKLCSNAKKYGAEIDKAGSISAIDWHIDFGQMRGDLSEIREQYKTDDQKHLNLRPFVVDSEFVIPEYKKYDNFRNFVDDIQNKKNNLARGKIKELRSVLKKGEVESRNYIRFNSLEDILYKPIEHFDKDVSKQLLNLNQNESKGLEKLIFSKEGDCLFFDGIEIMDTFIKLERGDD